MRRAAAAAAIIVLTTLGACGGSDDPAPAGGGTATSAGSSGDGGDTDAGAAAAGVDPCELLTVEQVGQALGGTVTAEAAPGGGCGFDQEDLRAPSVGFFAVDGAGGGFDATKAGLVVEGDPEDVAGVGDGAWFAVGRSGGDNLQGQGVVAIGDTLVNISLTQGNGLDEAAVRNIMTELVSLVGSLA